MLTLSNKRNPLFKKLGEWAGCFLLMALLPGHTDSAAPASPASGASPTPGRTLKVDRRGGADYISVAAAAKDAHAGDTIVIAPGSGPYRETLHITQSGTPDAPITVDGNGETVTGYDPLKFTKEGNTWVCDLQPIVDGFKSVQQFHLVEGHWVDDDEEKMTRPMPAFPGVLIYKGERVRQDAQTGQLTKYATLSQPWKLTLLPGVDPEAWELSSRPFVIQFYNASYQTYRNIRASGSLNDGFNGHGSCHGIILENVEGFENLDEGFSIHDDVHVEISNSRFYQNDNGINNAVASVVELTNVDLFDNLGWGFGLVGHGIAPNLATGKLNHVRIWGNGMNQFMLGATTTADCTDVTIYPPEWATRQWYSTQESRSEDKVETQIVRPTAILTGQPLLISPDHRPAPDSMPKLGAMPTSAP